jgi:hypothetical protein
VNLTCNYAIAWLAKLKDNGVYNVHLTKMTISNFILVKQCFHIFHLQLKMISSIVIARTDSLTITSTFLLYLTHIY